MAKKDAQDKKGERETFSGRPTPEVVKLKPRTVARKACKASALTRYKKAKGVSSNVGSAKRTRKK
jgi:hypothetical protein